MVSTRYAFLAGVLLTPIFLSTAGQCGETAATPFFTEDAPVDALARAYGFDVTGDMRSTRVFVTSADHEVVIAPGMSRALIDGVARELVCAPRYADGVLVVSADLADVIRRLGTSEPVGSSPGRPRPKRGKRPKAAFLPAGMTPARLVLAGGPPTRTAPRRNTGPLVVIDPGHGGFDEGARGPRGSKEKDVTLRLALCMAKHLQAMGCRVQLTRRNDTFIPLRERAEIANRARAAAFISIHANSFHDGSVHGTETWVADRKYVTPRLREQSKRLARAVQASVVGALRSRDRGVREGRYTVLRSAKVPAMLLEVGFLSHPATERILASARWRDRLGRELAAAVVGVLVPRGDATRRTAKRSR